MGSKRKSASSAVETDQTDYIGTPKGTVATELTRDSARRKKTKGDHITDLDGITGNVSMGLVTQKHDSIKIYIYKFLCHYTYLDFI
jgi:hypothetical protein